MTVPRSVPDGRVAARARPLRSNFQPKMMLNNRMRKVKKLDITTSMPTYMKIFRSSLVDFTSVAHEFGSFGL